MFTKEQQERAVAAAQHQQQVAQGLEAIFAAYPTLLRCDANRKIIIEHVRDFMEGDYAPDLDTFKNLIGLNPDLMSTMVHRPIEVTKAQYIDEYIELLAAHSRQDKYTLQQERNRLSHLSMEQCRQKLDELKRRQRMSSQPVAALKSFVADSRTDTRPYPGYPTLPPVLWDGGKHATVDAEYLNGLARADIYAFKRLCRLYGSQQIDHRRGLK